jgi:hypothetical protein
MSTTHPVFHPSPLAGRKQFEVPWAQVEHIQSRLAGHGIPATGIEKVMEKRALIEVDADVSADAIVSALAS